ncbi:hypothetical protein [Amorphus orientalis]|uniref:Uncharacterized protein n=1 Tax=Amorphus orientalis TaxID=649198 RepID=A0AAE4AWH1_9HYPH|nr:hypothetical protein [Amorphus orientalis]MDQ0317759.1 hypothetical protein [Amorphus orientalis]
MYLPLRPGSPQWREEEKRREEAVERDRVRAMERVDRLDVALTSLLEVADRSGQEKTRKLRRAIRLVTELRIEYG